MGESKRNIRCCELFCGLGGFRKGLENASERFITVFANDLDKYACQVYRNNYGNKELFERDIRAVDSGRLPEFDLLTAGFPCQAFSIAGKRLGFEDTRGTLIYEILRILRDKKPRNFLLENVKGLLSHDDGKTFQTILRLLSETGYSPIEWVVLNSKDFGVPQNRERVFIIGHLGGMGGREVFPIGNGNKKTLELQRLQSSTITARYGTAKSNGDYVIESGRTTQEMIVLGKMRKNGFKQIKTKGIVPTLMQAMGTGGNNVPMVMPVLTPNREKKRQNGRRMKENGEDMFTLTGQDIHGVAILSHSPRTNDPKLGGSGSLISDEHCFTLDSTPHNVIQPYFDGRIGRNTLKSQRTPEIGVNGMRIRRLTSIECEKLQGFPINFTKYGITKDGNEVMISDSQRYKMLGNAVTTNVITYIGKLLLEKLYYE